MDRVLVYPGADDVGSVLFARVFNLLHGYRPRIYVRYSSTLGPTVVPRYEDRPLHEGVKAQITSLGGVVLDSPERSDCMHALNSPGKRMSESMEQGNKDLTFSTHLNLHELFRFARYYHEEYGRPVGLAEVSVCNGCENDCMELGLRLGAYEFLDAAGGWNTAANTIGVVLAQLAVASYYDVCRGMQDERRLSDEFLAGSLAADWLYQSNVLPRFLLETQGRIDPYRLGSDYGETVGYFSREIQRLLDEKFPDGLRGGKPRLQTLEFQWDGVFYIRLRVSLEAERKGDGENGE